MGSAFESTLNSSIVSYQKNVMFSVSCSFFRHCVNVVSEDPQGLIYNSLSSSLNVKILKIFNNCFHLLSRSLLFDKML